MLSVFLSSILFAAQEPPPGLVLVKGGRTKIGTPVREVELLIAANEGVRHTLAGETPRHSVKVDDFYLMVTEVTNQQYAEYVNARGAKPPWTGWSNDGLGRSAPACRPPIERAWSVAKRTGLLSHSPSRQVLTSVGPWLPSSLVWQMRRREISAAR